MVDIIPPFLIINKVRLFMNNALPLPEITVKAVILSIILAVVLAAANAYLGLKVGITISASIPAAVISMGILRLFKTSNILENNIVQTAASAGEALVAGVIFILPALMILQFWHDFNYWETTLVAMIGGSLGVLFSIPLRRVLLADQSLRFPEGTAIGQVLKVSSQGKAGLKDLVKGGAIGSAISLFQAGFKVIADGAQLWFKAGNSFVFGLGTGFEPALLAAGYIVGISVAMSTFVGVIIGWIFGIPILSHIEGLDITKDATTIAIHIWKTDIRYIGVGTMLIGGIWTLITLIKPILEGLSSSFDSVRTMRASGYLSLPHTERDIPIHYALVALAILVIPLTFLFYHFTGYVGLQLTTGTQISVVAMGVLFTLFGGFIFASICGYFAGLVGSSNNPISGLAMSALLLSSLILLGLFTLANVPLITSVEKLAAAAFVVFLTTAVLTAAAITNDTIQDLKAGQIVGATPWKQQVMLILGTLVSALVVPPILELLFSAYGIGSVFPRPGMDPSQALSAPQAMLMATLAQGVFAHNLPWPMLITGALIAVACIITDTLLKKRNLRLPVLAVGLGIYLPLGVSMPLVFGGILSFIVERSLNKRYAEEKEDDHSQANQGRQRGLVAACGIVAGASLMGVVLAIPFTLAKSTDVLRLVPENFAPFANILGVVATAAVLYWLYAVVCRRKNH